MTTTDARAFIPRPKTRKAAPVAKQMDFAGGPEVPVYSATRIGHMLREKRLTLGLTTRECGRACSMNADEWKAIEEGALLVLSDAAALVIALDSEAARKALPEGLR